MLFRLGLNRLVKPSSQCTVKVQRRFLINLQWGVISVLEFWHVQLETCHHAISWCIVWSYSIFIMVETSRWFFQKIDIGWVGIFELQCIYLPQDKQADRQTASTVKLLIWDAPNPSRNLNVSRLVSQLPLPNPLKPGVKSRMKVQLEQRC